MDFNNQAFGHCVIFFGQKGHRPPRSDRARTPMSMLCRSGLWCTALLKLSQNVNHTGGCRQMVGFAISRG